MQLEALECLKILDALFTFYLASVPAKTYQIRDLASKVHALAKLGERHARLNELLKVMRRLRLKVKLDGQA